MQSDATAPEHASQPAGDTHPTVSHADGEATSPAIHDSASDSDSATGAAGETEAARSEGSGDTGENRRRGRGRDRNRRERHPELASDATDASGTAPEGLIQSGALATEAFQEAGTAMPAPLEPQPATHAIEAASMAAAEPVAPVVTAEEAPSAPALVPQASSTLASVPAPVAAAPEHAATPAAPFVLPMDSLQAVAEAAGLQWVSSDAAKIRAVQADMADTPKPAHVPRERKPVHSVDEEGPLVLIETRKDLLQIKLPFDATQGGASGPTPPQA
ncbi:MAG: hypothetical protein ABIP61_02525 [Burkholderiaceae bacterium]